MDCQQQVLGDQFKCIQENVFWSLKWILDIADLAKTMQPQALIKLDVMF